MGNRLHVRPAAASECQPLSALAFRSKAHWGYSRTFMAACLDELTVTPARLRGGICRVAVDQVDSPLGFYLLAPASASGIADLDLMFVDPPAIGRGVGGLLLRDAVAAARRAGYRAIDIVADPNAAAFYERMGARRHGECESESIPGRTLPRYELNV